VKKNLFTFSSKKLPWAAILTLLIVLSLELLSFGFIFLFKKRCAGGGDLVGLDHHPLCKNLHKYKTYNYKVSDKYKQIQYESWGEMGEKAPYDFIVAGSSVCDTGWAEMIRLDHGHKLLNTTFKGSMRYSFSRPTGLAKVVSNIEKINGGNRATIVWADYIESSENNFKMPYDFEKELAIVQNMKIKKEPWLYSRIVKLVNYFRKTGKVSSKKHVEIIELKDRPQLFFLPYLDALRSPREYDEKHYKNLHSLFSQYMEVLNEKKLELAMVAIPTKAQLYQWLMPKGNELRERKPRTNYELLKRVTTELGIPLLNLEEKLYPVARKLYEEKGEFLWPKSDTHMNKLGNRYVAEIVKEWLSKLEKNH